MQAEHVTGQYKGQPYDGVIYGALDDQGNRVGKPFKSSVFGKSLGFGALQTKCESTKKKLSSTPAIRQRLREVIGEAMRQAGTLDEFRELIAAKNVGAVIRINDSQRITGVTFIDFQTRLVINGSGIGKEYSANKFQERFGYSSLQESREIIPVATSQEEVYEYREVVQTIARRERHQTPPPYREALTRALLHFAEGLNIFPSALEPSGPPVQEEEFKVYRKKKKRIKIR